MSQYFGGKARIGKQLASVVNQYTEGVIYAEPFCGMYSVGSRVQAARKLASDAQPDLILLLQDIQAGWAPPDCLSEERYQQLKSEAPSALRGFAGFSCSFGGKFFGGYARNGQRNYADVGRRSLLRLRPLIQDTLFAVRDYKETPASQVTYCDPPYAKTTGYTVGEFDSDEFWQWCRDRAGMVLISEYVAPSDFDLVWSKPVKTDMRTKANGREQRIEKLFLAPERCYT